jgi:hypothetical protein
MMANPVIMPKKIALGFLRLADKITRASWVLSPSSATEIDSNDIVNASVARSIARSPIL